MRHIKNSASGIATLAVLVGAAPARECAASIVILSSERSVSVALEVGGTPPFKEIDALFYGRMGAWNAGLNATYSSTNFAMASQSTTISSSGISGMQSVSSSASMDPGITNALAGGLSQIDVIFQVLKESTFLLTAQFDFVSDGSVKPPSQPFLNVAGTNLFLPEPEGDGVFAVTIVLGPGVYNFSAITTAVTSLSGDANYGASSISLQYSFAVIPAPPVLLTLFPLPLTRRRRRTC